MAKLFVIATALVLVGIAAAQARTCNTTCSSYGGQTHCTTQCY